MQIGEACDAVEMPNLSNAEMQELQSLYNKDWNLGDEAHPCDLKSSIDPSGRVRSSYVPPPVLMA